MIYGFRAQERLLIQASLAAWSHGVRQTRFREIFSSQGHEAFTFRLFTDYLRPKSREVGPVASQTVFLSSQKTSRSRSVAGPAPS